MAYLDERVTRLEARVEALEQAFPEFRDETPTGAINGVNTDYELYLPPRVLQVYLNGLHQREGTDYTITGRIVSFTAAPETGDTVEVRYVGFDTDYRPRASQTR